MNRKRIMIAFYEVQIAEEKARQQRLHGTKLLASIAVVARYERMLAEVQQS